MVLTLEDRHNRPVNGMVNTFLVDSDFTRSAQHLDRQRLGKQRVEAMQILRLIEDLYRLRRLLDVGDPDSYPNLQAYILALVRHYRSLGFIWSVHGRLLLRYPSTHSGPMVGRPIKLGFVYHPAVRMWYHHPEALKLYINAHIDEWVRRGYTNNMTRYCVDPNVDRPSWTTDPVFHLNHRGSLITKERVRNEPLWYQQMPAFVSAPVFIDYIWPVR